MGEELRFAGELAEEYELITLAYPDFAEFQAGICESIRLHAGRAGRLVEIGTGNGFTTDLLLSEFPALRITTVDNDPQMVAQAQNRFAGRADGARVEIVLADALSHVRGLPDASQPIVASAFTLHNMERDYRDALDREVFRVLAPGGLFVNADKYAPDGQPRFDALAFQVEHFFDAFVPLGKLDLLRKWVVHNIADQSPRFVMFESESVARLRALGFASVEVRGRKHMQAVLSARK